MQVLVKSGAVALFFGVVACAAGGDPTGGDPFVGDALAGDTHAGDPIGGDAHAGDSIGGDAHVGDSIGGDAHAGDSQGGDSSEGDPGSAGDTDDPYSGRPLGQCVVNDDCPLNALGERLCLRSTPGGVCSGCGTADHCPADTDCNSGTCVAACDFDDDCPPGMLCSGMGRCIVQSCAQDICPTPLFGCNASDYCQRAVCPGACPPYTTCVDGLCIEDRAL
jgi:hypothetical protein